MPCETMKIIEDYIVECKLDLDRAKRDPSNQGIRTTMLHDCIETMIFFAYDIIDSENN